MLQALCKFMQRYLEAMAGLMRRFELPEPMLYAKSYTGMLDMMKMDMLFSPEFTGQDMERASASWLICSFTAARQREPLHRARMPGTDPRGEA